MLHSQGQILEQNQQYIWKCSCWGNGKLEKYCKCMGKKVQKWNHVRLECLMPRRQASVFPHSEEWRLDSSFWSGADKFTGDLVRHSLEFCRCLLSPKVQDGKMLSRVSGFGPYGLCSFNSMSHGTYLFDLLLRFVQKQSIIKAVNLSIFQYLVSCCSWIN